MSSSDSASDSSQTQVSTSKDNRIVGEAGSVNFADSNGNVVQMLDAGAVDKSFKFAESIAKGAASTQAASVAQIGATTKSALDAVKDAYNGSAERIQDMAENSNASVSKAYQGMTEALADAWQESKAGEQKLLAFGVMAVIGVVGFVAMSRD